MPNNSCGRIDQQKKSRTGPNPLQKQVAPASKDLSLLLSYTSIPLISSVLLFALIMIG
jgi:hypothetical protein